MSFARTNEFIKEGDTAIVYVSFNKLYPIRVTQGLSHHTKYGSLKHTDLIGKRYGSKIKCTQGSVYVLQGSPEIWTISLPHRTQIIYTPNISVITLQLELKPGSIVVESGTGSASLSHALIRTIYPSGHLHTFEFHLQRSEQARKEFKDHGVSEYATVYHRDVCNDGFGLEDMADAVFLDLPSPWKAIETAKKALKREGGRICSFSPCIEQVQKTAAELTAHGFKDIFTVECLRRVLSIKKYEMHNFDFNMDWKPKQAETEATDADSKPEVEAMEAETTAAAEEQPKVKESQKEVAKKPNKKKYKRYSRGNDDQEESSDNDDDDEEDDANGGEEVDKNKNGLVTHQYVAKPINIQPGHTSFLTFATLLHKDFQSF